MGDRSKVTEYMHWSGCHRVRLEDVPRFSECTHCPGCCRMCQGLVNGRVGGLSIEVNRALQGILVVDVIKEIRQNI